jgi:hypothetical protein
MKSGLSTCLEKKWLERGRYARYEDEKVSMVLAEVKIIG